MLIKHHLKNWRALKNLYLSKEKCISNYSRCIFLVYIEKHVQLKKAGKQKLQVRLYMERRLFMKYKWLYIGLIFSIMMALVPVSTFAYTNTPHKTGESHVLKMKRCQMQGNYIQNYYKKMVGFI